MASPSTIECRFCGRTNGKHGDDCPDCGCPKCGFPGGCHIGSDGIVRGFCPDCGWEVAPGAYAAWKAKQPKLTTHQMYRKMMGMLGADLPPDDEVGAPIVEEL